MPTESVGHPGWCQSAPPDPASREKEVRFLSSQPRHRPPCEIRSLDELPLVLNISETASALGLHRSTIVRMISDGRLATCGRAGARSPVLISKNAIEAFLQGGPA